MRGNTDRRLSGMERPLPSLRLATVLPTGGLVMNGGADPIRSIRANTVTQNQKFPYIGLCCRGSGQSAVRRLGCGARCRFLTKRSPKLGKVWASRSGTDRSQEGNHLASGVRPARGSTDHDPVIPAAHPACARSGSVVLSSQVSSWLALALLDSSAGPATNTHEDQRCPACEQVDRGQATPPS